MDFIGKYHSPRLSQYLAPLLRVLTRMVLRKNLGAVTTVKEFQEVISYYAKRIVDETMTEFVYSGLDQLDADGAY